jgi:energy-coupling factor transporter ATP-binding protein EcfA2
MTTAIAEPKPRLDNSTPGAVVFHMMPIGLASEMRRVGLRATDHVRDSALHRDFEERRVVIVGLNHFDDATAAHQAAERSLDHYHAERAGILDLREMHFPEKPEEFVPWWLNQLEGNYEHAGDFLEEAEKRVVTWVTRPAADHASDFSANGSTANGQEGYGSATDEELGIVSAESITEAPISWLWPYRFAEGEMALLAGDGGLGKSSLLLAIAALITRGQEWPDKSGYAPLGSVAIVSAEDSRETTLKPRLMALGADLSRVRFVTAKITIRKPGEPAMVSPMTLSDRPYWKEVLRRIPGCKMLIIDPIPSYLGRGVNDSKNSELRAVLEPFLELVARPAGICFVANSHLNKSLDSKTPMHRITGSMAYGNLPRNVHFVVADPDNQSRAFFKQAKCNNAPKNLPAIAYELVKTVITSPAGDIETSYPVFETETVQVDLAETMGAVKTKRGPAPEKTMAVALWLLDYLRAQAGPTSLRDVFNAAGAMGFVGKQKAAANGYLRWSVPGTLYRAKEDMVPKLEAPNDGWIIDDIKSDGIYWQAVRATKELTNGTY